MENSLTCGCGCWGVLVGVGVWALAVILGIAGLKAFALGVLAIVVCAIIGAGLDFFVALFS